LKNSDIADLLSLLIYAKNSIRFFKTENFIMRPSKFLAMAAASTLACAPIVAQAGTISKTVAASKVKRAGAAVKKESKLGGKNGVLIALAAAAAAVAIIVIADGPSSP
jgi:hypothetical protein